MKNFIKNTFLVLSFLFLVISIPNKVEAYNQNAVLYFNASKTTLEVGENTSIDIFLDADENHEITTVEASFNVPINGLEISSDIVDIENSNFPIPFKNEIIKSLGDVRLSLSNNIPQSGTCLLVGNIEITALEEGEYTLGFNTDRNLVLLSDKENTNVLDQANSINIQVLPLNGWNSYNNLEIINEATKFLYKKGSLDENKLENEKLITRAEAIKVLVKSLYSDVHYNDEDVFLDVSKNAWYYKYINFAYKKGIINGYENKTFKPEQSVSRAEFLKMLSKAYNLEENLPFYYEDINNLDWFAKYVGISEKYKLFEDSSYFNPTKSLNMQDLILSVYKVINFQ